MKAKLTLIVTLLVIMLGSVYQVALQQEGSTGILFTQMDTDDTPYVDDKDYPKLRFTFTPVNEFGVPIGTLTKADFVVREDDLLVDNFQWRSFVDDSQGISVMLVLDVSGSMREDLPALQEAAAMLYDELEQTDESGTIVFSILEDGTSVDMGNPFPQINTEREISFTNDEGALRNLIDLVEIKPLDGTPLFDALYKGARMASQDANNERRAVILMTDGLDQNRTGVKGEGSSVYDADSVIDELRRFNVPVFTIGLGTEPDSAFLQRVANATGATYQNTPEASELGDLFTEIATMLKQNYSITYDSKVGSDNELHDIEIGVRTALGDAVRAGSFKASYPLEPWIREVQAANPRNEPRELDEFEGVKGTVTIEPDIVAREDIAEVNYYVNDELVHTANETPWTFQWNTRELEPDQSHALRIEAKDDANPPHIGNYTLDVPVEECSVICAIEERFGIPAEYLLGGVLFLLFLLVLILVIRRRRRDDSGGTVPPYEGAGETQPGFDLADSPDIGVYAPFPDQPVGPPVGQSAPTIGLDYNAVPGAAPGLYGSAGQQSTRTEALRKEPEEIAFLFDINSERDHKLFDETEIGRLAGNDIVLDDPAISERHAKIKLENKEFVIYDLAATNPTRVNDKEITAHTLKDGDRVMIGRDTLVFKRVI